MKPYPLPYQPMKTDRKSKGITMISRKKSKQLIYSHLIVPSIGMFILLIGAVLFAGSGGDGSTDILITAADTGLTISEMGHEATLNISLTRAPTENVSIGLNVKGGQLFLSDSVVLSNKAKKSGGGIFNGGSVTLNNVEITENNARRDKQIYQGMNGYLSATNLHLSGKTIDIVKKGKYRLK